MTCMTSFVLCGKVLHHGIDIPRSRGRKALISPALHTEFFPPHDGFDIFRLHVEQGEEAKNFGGEGPKQVKCFSSALLCSFVTTDRPW